MCTEKVLSPILDIAFALLMRCELMMHCVIHFIGDRFIRSIRWPKNPSTNKAGARVRENFFLGGLVILGCGIQILLTGLYIEGEEG